MIKEEMMKKYDIMQEPFREYKMIRNKETKEITAVRPETIILCLDRIESLENQLRESKHQLEESEQKRLKAIEYVKDKQKIQYKYALSHIECDELLEILGDDEK